MAINLGQIKLNNAKNAINEIDASVNQESYFRPEAIIGYNFKKEQQRIAIHKEILRVSLETLKV